MANSFHRVSQSLRADNALRSNVALLIALPLLTGWVIWAFSIRVTRSETSESARVEMGGKLHVTAEFLPSAALGKIYPGQQAVFRAAGFPPAQYGTVSAQVSQVSGEIRDGKIRVEFRVNPASPSRIPFQHGLPGSVEVQIERISPAALILRWAGDLVGGH